MDTQQTEKTTKKDEKQALYNKLVEKLPPIYKDLKPNEELYNKLSNNKSLLLVGNVGSGKTRAMLETILQLQIIGYYDRKLNLSYNMDFLNNILALMGDIAFRRIFYSVPKLLLELKKEFDTNTTGTLVEKLIQARYLFLDDLGVEKGSEWVKEQLYIIINERYMWNKPVMITTNLSIQEIATNYGDRLASRLVEMCEIVKYNGEDRRLRK